jgi:hypothetical protein
MCTCQAQTAGIQQPCSWPGSLTVAFGVLVRVWLEAGCVGAPSEGVAGKVLEGPCSRFHSAAAGSTVQQQEQQQQEVANWAAADRWVFMQQLQPPTCCWW